MDEKKRAILIANMTENLPTLRKKLGVSQEELSSVLGINRSTRAAIENHKRTMTWNMFLALLLVFTKNEETNKLLNVMDIYTDEFNEFIKHAADDQQISGGEKNK